MYGDELDIGCTPTGEDCAQVGADDYMRRSRVECRAFIGQLRRMFGAEPNGARLVIRSNPHDFGTYLSVVCVFDGSEDARAYAYRCEGETPESGDDTARAELESARLA